MQAVEAGYTNAIFGGAPGFDIISAELIRATKMTASNEIKIICALPYNGFNNSRHFNEGWKLRYESMIKDCDHVINVTGKDYEIYGCYQNRNKYMVNNSSRLICYHTDIKGGTANTV